MNIGNNHALDAQVKQLVDAGSYDRAAADGVAEKVLNDKRISVNEMEAVDDLVYRGHPTSLYAGAFLRSLSNQLRQSLETRHATEKQLHQAAGTLGISAPQRADYAVVADPKQMVDAAEHAARDAVLQAQPDTKKAFVALAHQLGAITSVVYPSAPTPYRPNQKMYEAYFNTAYRFDPKDPLAHVKAQMLGTQGLVGDGSARAAASAQAAVEAAGMQPRLMAAPLGTAALKKAITAGVKGARYVSEQDFPLVFCAAPNPTDAPVSAGAVQLAFGAIIAKAFRNAVTPLEPGDLTAESWGAADTKKFLADEAKPNIPSDPYSKANAKGFRNLKRLLAANLTDVRVVEVGPKDAKGHLKTDDGLYMLFIVGKTHDGHIAGVYTDNIET